MGDAVATVVPMFRMVRIRALLLLPVLPGDPWAGVRVGTVGTMPAGGHRNGDPRTRSGIRPPLCPVHRAVPRQLRHEAGEDEPGAQEGRRYPSEDGTLDHRHGEGGGRVDRFATGNYATGGGAWKPPAPRQRPDPGSCGAGNPPDRSSPSGVRIDPIY